MADLPISGAGKLKITANCPNGRENGLAQEHLMNSVGIRIVNILVNCGNSSAFDRTGNMSIPWAEESIRNRNKSVRLTWEVYVPQSEGSGRQTIGEGVPDIMGWRLPNRLFRTPPTHPYSSSDIPRRHIKWASWIVFPS